MVFPLCFQRVPIERLRTVNGTYGFAGHLTMRWGRFSLVCNVKNTKYSNYTQLNSSFLFSSHCIKANTLNYRNYNLDIITGFSISVLFSHLHVLASLQTFSLFLSYKVNFVVQGSHSPHLETCLYILWEKRDKVALSQLQELYISHFHLPVQSSISSESW